MKYIKKIISNRGTSLVSIFIMIIVPAIVTCTTKTSPNDNSQYLKDVFSRKHKKLESYNFDPNSSLASRVKLPPGFVVDSIRKWEKKKNINGYSISAKERRLVNECLEYLPKRVKKILKQRLVGIYFIENFVGGGYTNWIADRKKNIYCYILLPSDLFTENLSGYLSYKASLLLERSLFRGMSPWQISIDAGKNYRAFVYSLIHEIAHVVDYVMKVTPFVWFELRNFQKKVNQGISDFPFILGVWKSYYYPQREYDFFYRPLLINFWVSGKSKIEPEELTQMFQAFRKTPFVSLYSTKSWVEDFADFFTYYFITEILKEPYKINLKKYGRIVFQYEPMKTLKVKRRIQKIEWLFEK